MKNSLRILTLSFIALSLFSSCSKKNGEYEFPTRQYPPVFNSYSEAGDAVSLYLQQAGAGEQFLEVENILFMESGNKTYALVFYESNFGHSNILYEQEYQGQQLAAGKTYKCINGTNCTCKVVTNIGSIGDVSFECSCSSCTLVVNNF